MNPYRDEKGHWTNKENNNGPCPHNEILNNTETNSERTLAYNPKRVIQNSKIIFDKVTKKGYYGTYDFLGNEITDRFSKQGYQVSGFRPEIFDELDDDEINQLINAIKNYLGDLEYSDIGVFGGSPEISHYTTNLNKAMKVARLFNQESILNWRLSKDKDNPFFITNPYFKGDEYKMTKEEFLKNLKELEK